MTHEHERAAGAWQAEWVAMPQLFLHTAASVAHAARALDGLEVHAERMRANLEIGGGTLMSESLSTALAARLGRIEAQELVKRVSARASREGITLRVAALGDERVTAALSAADVDRALDPERYLGSSDALIDRALASFRNVS
jgi:3-carboxy-cis,cis-muconate cycloisomerase